MMASAQHTSEPDTAAPFRESENNAPVEIGLVLSGGGAKGIAHIGVLHVLDSLNIPVNMVAGTSMGAIVGGLYAIGYTPDQISDVLQNINWEDLLSQKPQRKYLTFAEKDNPEMMLVNLQLNGTRLMLPSGFNNGQNVYNKLSELTIDYHNEKTDFSRFPRPFVCNSTDLNTGREKVIDRGPLVDAMRASMAIPSLFSPYSHGGRMVVDGGVVNNFPANHLPLKPGTVLIGSDVQTTIGDTLGIPSISKVLERTSLYINFSTTHQRFDLCRYVLKPDMTGFTVTDFSKAKEIYDRGMATARAYSDSLTELCPNIESVRPQKIAAYQPKDSVYIRSIEITGLQKTSPEAVEGLLNMESGNWVKLTAIQDAMQRIYGNGLYQSVRFRLPNHPHGGYILKVMLQEKSTYAKIGVGLNYNTDFRTGLLLNYTQNNLLMRGSTFYGNLVLGDFPRAEIGYIADRGILPGFGLVTRVFSQKPSITLSGDFVGNLNYTDWSTDLFFQTTLDNKVAFKIGGRFDMAFYRFRELNVLPAMLDNPMSDVTKNSQSHLAVYFNIVFDNFNQRYFNREGSKVDAGFTVYNQLYNSYGSEFLASPFAIAHINLQRHFPVSRKVWVETQTFFGITPLNRASAPYQMYFGGMGHRYLNNTMPFAGFNYYEVKQVETGRFYQDAIALYGHLVWEFHKNHHLKLISNTGIFGTSIEHFIQNPDWISGYGLGYSFSSLVGPLEIYATSTPNRRDIAVYLSLGYWF